MHEVWRLPLLPRAVDSNVGFWPVELWATVWPTDKWSTLDHLETRNQDLATRLLVKPVLPWWCMAPSTATDQTVWQYDLTGLASWKRTGCFLWQQTWKHLHSHSNGLLMSWHLVVLSSQALLHSRPTCGISYHFWVQKPAPPRTFVKFSRTRKASSTVSSECRISSMYISRSRTIAAAG